MTHGGGWPRGELSSSIPIVNGIVTFLGKKEQNKQKKLSSFRLPHSALLALWLSRAAASSPYSGKANPTGAGRPPRFCLGRCSCTPHSRSKSPSSRGAGWPGMRAAPGLPRAPLLSWDFRRSLRCWWALPQGLGNTAELIPKSLRTPLLTWVVNKTFLPQKTFLLSTTLLPILLLFLLLCT